MFAHLMLLKRFILFLLFLPCLPLVLKGQKIDTLLVQEVHFNQGLVFSLPHAIQGQIPGILISRPGANPNGSFDMIYRGFHTYQNRMRPLLVMDGMPGLTWEFIDPFLIDTISFVNGAGAASWGMQAGAGVVNIGSKPVRKEGWTVGLVQSAAVESHQRSYDVFTPQEYRALKLPGHPDGNTNTDWEDVLSRNAWSMHTGVQGSYRKDNLYLDTKLSNRSVQGIQPHTGFDQLSLYGNLGYSMWDDRVSIDLSGLRVNRQARIGNSDFFEGMMMNPTWPLEEPFEAFTRFRGNPWIRMQEERNTVETAMHFFQANVTANLTDRWRVSSRYGQVGKEMAQERTYSNRAGISQTIFPLLFRERSHNRSLLEFTTDYQADLGNWKITPGLRYARQGIGYVWNGYNERLIDLDQTATIREDLKEELGKFTLESFGASLNLVYREKLGIDIRYQPERASHLGSNAGWGNFWGMDVSYAAGDRWRLFAKLSYTGLAPDQSGLSQTVFDVGELIIPRHFANPDLQWERSNAWELGADVAFAKGIIVSRNAIFRNQASGLMALLPDEAIFDPQGLSFISFSYQNFASIENYGFESSWLFKLIDRKKFKYQSGLNLTWMHSEWTNLEADLVSWEGRDVGVSRQVGGNPYFQFNTLRTGEALGTVRALEFQRIDRNTGQWVFNQNLSGTNWQDAYRPKGRVIPRWWMGWNHGLSFGKWSMDAFFRGVFGHVLAHETNFRYGNVNFFALNRVRSSQELVNLGLTEQNTFNSYFVENSSFLNLQFLTVSRSFDLTIGRTKMSSRLSVIGNNLFYLTRFSGADPEPRLHGRPVWNVDDHVEKIHAYYASGIADANSWLPGRSWMLRLEVNF